MKNLRNKAVGLILTAAVLMSAILPTGCKTREERDIEAIQDVTEQFIEAFGTGEPKKLKGLVERKYDYELNTGNRGAVAVGLASKTEIETFETVMVDRETLTAKARVKLSYIDAYNFSKSLGENAFITEEDCLDKIDSYKDRETVNFTFNFVYDKDDESWIVKERSAIKYADLFNETYYINIVTITPEEVMELDKRVFEGIANGNFIQPEYQFYLDDIRVFDDLMYNEPILIEAAGEFAKAYFTYIVDHGYTLAKSGDYPYAMTLYGTAPSQYEILEYLKSDEHIIEIYMFTLRAAYGYYGKTTEEIYSEMYAEIYFDLAKRIPDMSGEDYSLDFIFGGEYDNDPHVTLSGDLITVSRAEAESVNISDEQITRCYWKAIENLYFAGEISKEQYEELISQTDSVTGRQPEPEEIINWEGTQDHENQAVDVYEYTPDWSDGSLIYGKSSRDSNGFSMHYSKEPGWLDTAGYCIDDEGITVMVRLDHKFEKDTVLEYDWYLNGERVVTAEKITVEDSENGIFEFTMPVKLIKNVYTCEFRLWEEGHSHVISYVELTQT